MNIINNRVDLDLGEKLNSFRSETTDMTPMDRGIALDGFDHVRDGHNSFSTRFDQMVVDLRLKEDSKPTEKEKKKAAAAAAKASAHARRPRLKKNFRRKRKVLDSTSWRMCLRRFCVAHGWNGTFPTKVGRTVGWH
jgi:hypothetical protein